jgi:hypothetical protein
MKRRLLIAGLFAFSLCGATTATRAEASGYWACAGSELLNIGVCVSDPLPDHLPTLPKPTVPSELPAAPPSPV